MAILENTDLQAIERANRVNKAVKALEECIDGEILSIRITIGCREVEIPAHYVDIKNHSLRENLELMRVRGRDHIKAELKGILDRLGDF